MSNYKAILIPGNGGGSVQDSWFPWVKTELEKIGIPTLIENFPDPVLAREKFWLPFLKKLGADEKTILIGHSSGAEAAMRYAETNKIFGSILVGACYTDLGMEEEKLSGYYNRPWNWQSIKDNQQWIAQFASTDDPFIPIAEARYVHKNLQTEYYEYTDQGHFGRDKNRKIFPEIIRMIESKV